MGRGKCPGSGRKGGGKQDSQQRGGNTGERGERSLQEVGEERVESGIPKVGRTAKGRNMEERGERSLREVGEEEGGSKIPKVDRTGGWEHRKKGGGESTERRGGGKQVSQGGRMWEK